MAATSKVREELAKQFMDALSKNQMPWAACWRQLRPMNATTGKPYRGVNAFMLSWIAEGKGYKDPRWCTYKQAEERGWQVRKGEKASPVEYWAYYDRKAKKLLSWNDARVLISRDPDYANENLLLSCRTHSVFNAEQIDGIPELELPRTDIGELRKHRDLLVQNMAVRYLEQGDEAYYSPSADAVVLPPEQTFDDPYSYMTTFLHECGHATGHASRLNRDLTGRFGSESYAREELRAEISAAFTAQELGLQLSPEQLQKQAERHAAYVQNWAGILEKSPDELFKAIKDAEQISDYLLEKGEFQIARDLASGQLGDIKYTVSAEPGKEGLVLNFSGHGQIPDPSDPTGRPWLALGSEISEVRFSRGITDTGCGTLAGLDKVCKVSIPSGTQLSDAALLPNLQEICFIPDTLRKQNAQELHSPRSLLQLIVDYPSMNRNQLIQIDLAQRHQLTKEQIALFADGRYSAEQMQVLRYCQQDKLTEEQFAAIANPKLSALQMDLLRHGFRYGMPDDRVFEVAHPEVPAAKMLDHLFELREDRLNRESAPAPADDGYPSDSPEM